MIRVPRLERPDDAFHNTHVERVRFGDTDAAGIVYYANYLRYFEAGRAELMRAAGVPYVELVDEGWFMPVVESWVRYHRPARYDDELHVVSWVHEVRFASLLIGTLITRGEELVAEGAARLGCVDADGKPQRLPAQLKRFAR